MANPERWAQELQHYRNCSSVLRCNDLQGHQRQQSSIIYKVKQIGIYFSNLIWQHCFHCKPKCEQQHAFTSSVYMRLAVAVLIISYQIVLIYSKKTVLIRTKSFCTYLLVINFKSLLSIILVLFWASYSSFIECQMHCNTSKYRKPKGRPNKRRKAGVLNFHKRNAMNIDVNKNSTSMDNTNKKSCLFTRNFFLLVIVCLLCQMNIA